VNDCGYESIGVPGTVAGLAEALRRHGTWTWREALQPGLRAARQGMLVTAHVHAAWLQAHSMDVVPNGERLRWTAESRRLYTREGELYSPGQTVANTDL